MTRWNEEMLEFHPDIFLDTTVDAIRKILNLIKFANLTSVFPQSLIARLNQRLPTRRDEMIELLVSLLKDDDVLRTYYEHMDDLERAFIGEIVRGDGTFDYAHIQAKYGAVPPYAYADHYERTDETKFHPLSLFISRHGCMPMDIMRRLSAFVPSPKTVQGVFVDQLPSHIEIAQGRANDGKTGLKVPLVIHQTQQAALHDIKAVLRLISMEKLSVSPHTFQITRASADQVKKILLAGDFYLPGTEAQDTYDIQMGEEGIRPFAWALLVQAGKLCKAHGNKLKLTPKGEAALGQSASLTLKGLWEEWMPANLIHELNRVEAVKGQYSRSHPLRAASECRGYLESTLKKMTIGLWMSMEEFERCVIAHGYGFEAARNAWELYIADKQYGSFGYDNSNKILNRRYMFAFLLEYAATLGVIDVALTLPWESNRKDLGNMWGADSYSCLSRYDGLMYFRLNPLGSWILNMSASYTEKMPERTTAFRITPNLEINVIADRIMPAEELFLERIGERSSERVWKFSRRKILTAIEEGMEVDKVQEFLSAHSEEIPETVKTFLGDITERAKKIKFAGDCCLMECVDEHTALLMANDTQLKKLIVVANHQFLVIRQDDRKKFRTQLIKMGYVLSS